MTSRYDPAGQTVFSNGNSASLTTWLAYVHPACCKTASHHHCQQLGCRAHN